MNIQTKKIGNKDTSLIIINPIYKEYCPCFTQNLKWELAINEILYNSNKMLNNIYIDITNFY